MTLKGTNHVWWTRILMAAFLSTAFVASAAAADCKYLQGAIPIEDDNQPTSPTGAWAVPIFDPAHPSIKVHWADGSEENCPAHLTDSGMYVHCAGFSDADTRFGLFGKSISRSLADDIMFFHDSAWYRDPKCKG